MVEQATKTIRQSPSEIMKRIEIISSEFPYEIKVFREKVSAFLKSDKKLSALKASADRRPSGKKADKLDTAVKLYRAEYRECMSTEVAISKKLDDAEALYKALYDYHSESGRKRDAKRIAKESEKLLEPKRKKLAAVSEDLKSALLIELAAEEKTEEKQVPKEAPRLAPQSRQANPTPNYYRSAPQMQYGVPTYTQPMPMYAPQPYPPMYTQPMTVDVNAVADHVLDGFVNRFEEGFAAYLESFKTERFDAHFSRLEEAYARVGALADKVSESESLVLQKLISTSERLVELLQNIQNLTSSFADFEDKMKKSLEGMRAVNEMQRGLSRELQGVSATQKVINSDQSRVAEEQAVIYEIQKENVAHQSEISEAQKTLDVEFATLLEAQKTISESVRKTLENHGEMAEEQQAILRVGEKLHEMQKALVEKQSALQEMQKEAANAQKKLTRTQKSFNDKHVARDDVKALAAETKTGEETQQTEELAVAVLAAEEAAPEVSAAEETALEEATLEVAVAEAASEDAAPEATLLEAPNEKELAETTDDEGMSAEKPVCEEATPEIPETELPRELELDTLSAEDSFTV